MKKIIYLLGAMLFLGLFSCEQDEVSPKADTSEYIANPVLIKESVDAGVVKQEDIANERSTNGLYFNYLYDTNNGTRYYSPGLYAVEIRRSWYDASSISVRLVGTYTNQSNPPIAWADLLTSSYSKINSWSGKYANNDAQVLPYMSIYGSNRLQLFVRIYEGGYYMTNY